MGFSASRNVRNGIAESLGGQSGDRQYQFNQLGRFGITISSPASRNQLQNAGAGPIRKLNSRPPQTCLLLCQKDVDASFWCKFLVITRDYFGV